MKRLFSLIKARFPEYEITPLSGGGTNALYLLERNGKRTVLKLAMISNRNAAVEEECLHMLNRNWFVPRLYESFEIDGRTGLRMEYIEGLSFLSLILESLKDADVDKLIALFSSLGELLAELHAVQISSDHHLPCFSINPPEKKAFIEENLYQRSVQRILGISGDMGLASVLVHGDFGYHNVIRDLSGRNRVIDWEMAGIGDPRMDLANVLFWTHLHFPDQADRFGESFIQSYLNRRLVDCSPELIHSFVIFQFWRILGLVKEEFPEHVKTEWNRRLAWALNHKFI